MDGESTSRRRRGVVMFRGVQTGGYQGAGTQVMAVGCCPSCVEAGQKIEHHVGCVYDDAVIALVAEGFARQVCREGEWQIDLTEAGIKAFGQTTTRRSRSARRAAKAR